MQEIDGISQLGDKYKVLFCDAWGVIHNGISLFPRVTEALQNFSQQGGCVIIITNAPRPSNIIAQQLQHLKLPCDAYYKIVTSGDVCVHLLEQKKHLLAYRLGPDKDDELFASVGVKFTDFELADYILCTGMLNDRFETPDDYRQLFELALKKNKGMICVNPDKIVHYGEQILYCAGALAQVYQELGGKVEYCGKPYNEIYDLAFSRAKEKFTNLQKHEILCIGDNYQTDIMGALQSGLDVMYVKSGIGSDIDKDNINYVSNYLKW